MSAASRFTPGARRHQRAPDGPSAWRSVLAVVVLGVLPSGLFSAEERSRFEDTSRVVSVEVPVEVVGRDGQPIRGLTAQDFEVYDEGQKQELKHFEMVDLDHLDTAKRPGGLPSSEQLEPAARRHFLLLFDLSFARPASVQHAREAARDFVLRSLRPSDLVAVATYSLQFGPRLVITFTPDRAQLARAVLSLGLDNSTDAKRQDPLRFLLTTPADEGLASSSSAGTARSPVKGAIEAAASQERTLQRTLVDRADKTFDRTQVSSFLRSMSDLGKILSAVNGRKHVILFSEGFDSRLLLGHGTSGLEAAQDNELVEHGDITFLDNDNRYGNTPLQGMMQLMLQEFKRADCVVDAVDIGGLRAGGNASDEQRAGGDESLFVIADGTGGELFKDANDLRDQIGRVFDRSAVTYVLTFERSDLKPDGAFRRLKVKAKLPPGAKLTYRTGYYAPRPFPQIGALERSLLASDGIASGAPRDDLDLNVLVSSFRAGGGASYVPIIIEVSGASLLAGHPSDDLKLEFYAYVSDSVGEMKDFLTQGVALNVKSGRGAMAATGVKYYGHLELPVGDYRVRILVRDSQTGRTGVRMIPLRVPAYAETESILLPPFFMQAQAGWLMVRERAAKAAQDTVVYPFTVNGEPYVPLARPALAALEPARLCLVGYNLGHGSLQVRSHVTTPEGRPLTGGSLAVIERTSTGVPGLDKLLAEFRPTGLAAGNYVLQVAVKDPGTGREGFNSLPFRVLQ